MNNNEHDSSGAWRPLAAALLLTLTASYPLLIKGILLGHSGALYMMWTDQFAKSINSGVLHPSWVMDTNAGCGSATFIFYPNLVFYAFALTGVFVREVPMIINIASVACMLATTAAMYFLLRRHFGGWLSAVVSLLYTALPYHLLDLYERSALAELWTFAWLPLVFLCIENLKERRPLAFAGLAVSYALIVLSHLPTVLLSAPFIAIYVGFLFWIEKDFIALGRRILGFVFGVALSAFYLAPSMLEQNNVNIGSLTEDWLAYSRNFLFSETAGDTALNWFITKMAVALLPVLAVCLVMGIAQRRRNSERARLMIVFPILGLLSYPLMLSFSRPVWELVPILQKVGFPWRLLVMTSFFHAFCLAFVIDGIGNLVASWKRFALAAITLITLSFNISYSVSILTNFSGMPFDEWRKLPAWSIDNPLTYRKLSENFAAYLPSNKFLMDVVEFRPKWSVSKISRSGITLPQAILEGEYGIFEGGSGWLDVIVWEPEFRRIQANSIRPSRLLVRTFYYPGWKAVINGMEASISADPNFGLISIDLPEGASDIELRFEKSPVQKYGNIISAISLLIVAVYAVFARRGPKRR